MKHALKIMLMILFAFSLYAQNEKEARKVELADGSFVVPDVYPELKKPVKPEYPKQAILQDIQGKVFVRVKINEQGKVEDAKIAQGINSALNKAALAAAKKMEFSPAVYNGKKVKAAIAVPINFILDPQKEGPKLDVGIPVPKGDDKGKPDVGIEIKKEVKGEEPDPAVFVEVEKSPEPIKLVKPVYPEVAQKAGLTGIVVLRVLVNTEGKPIKAVVIKADNEVFIEPAKKAALETLFSPAVQNGKPITCWLNMPFRFSLAKPAEKKN